MLNGRRSDNFILMKISLVIPAYNEEKYIGACLESIEKYGKDFFEVIVINNGSDDRTGEIARSFSFVRLVNEPTKGLPRARQRGLEEAKGDLIAYVDADTKIPENWVSKINKELVCLSGPYVCYDASLPLRFFMWIYFTLLAVPTYFIIGYMAISGNLVMKKNILESIGGFDHNISFYGDDTDIAKRASAIGKVKFMKNFYMYTSARRMNKDGVLITAFRYVINFFAIVFIGKPITYTHSDIR